VTVLPFAQHRPTWAEIDLDALAHNVRVLRGRLGAAGIMAVIKADAYGHGALPVARALEREGVEWLAVALPEEGVELRSGGVRSPVLVMGGFEPPQADLILDHSLTAAVFRPDQVEALSAAASRRGRKAEVHVKVDTGMGRLGVPAAEVGGFAALLAGAAGLTVSGAFSHLAAADDPDDPFTAEQANLFLRCVAALKERGLRPALLHLANSPAVIGHRSTWMMLARPGLLLFGCNPVRRGSLLPVRPVMAVRSKVVFLKDLPAGASVGYGRAWRAATPSRIATLSIGYADGLPRAAGNRGEVLLRGRRAPIAGRISMDLTTIDVTAIPGAALGDVATVIGAAEGDAIGAGDVADAAGTIPWEILSRIGARVPRLFLESGGAVLSSRFCRPGVD
jgi:alanine racemase